MRNYIIVGCDLSDESMVLRIAHNEEAPVTRRWSNDAEGRRRMMRHLAERAASCGGAKIRIAGRRSARQTTVETKAQRPRK